MSLTKNKLRKKKKHPIRRLLLGIIALALIYGGYLVYANRMLGTEYAALQPKEQRMLDELNKIASAEDALWSGYDIFPLAVADARKKDVLSYKLFFRDDRIYTFGTGELLDIWYLRALDMPEEIVLPDVYRMSWCTPGFGKTFYPLRSCSKEGDYLRAGYEDEIFYLKYDFSGLEQEELPVREDLIVKLTKEQFPLQMLAERQEAVKDLSQLSAGIDAGDPTGDLTAKQQEAFDRLQSLLYLDATEDEWKIAIRNYLDASGKLKLADEAAFLQRSSEETIQGITDYVSYLAYARVHDQELKELLPISAEDYQMTLADKGAVLCAVIAERGPQNWQELLNQDPYLTLFDLLKQMGAEG